jgi:acyl-coenzyme A synthetase/AMP-(fatty) acid ligase
MAQRRRADVHPETMLAPEQLRALKNDSTLGCGNFCDKVLALQTCSSKPFIHLQAPFALSHDQAYQELSLDDLNALRMALAKWYLSIGARPGDVITVCVSDGIAPFLHYIALTSIGAVACIVNPRMSAEMAPEYLASNHFFRAVIDDGVRESSPVARFLSEKADSRFTVHNISKATLALCTREDMPRWWPFQPSDNTLVMLSHTSGTTGTSKAVKFEHRQFFMGKRDRLGRFLESHEDRFLTALPPSHSSAISHLETAVLHGVPTYVMSDCGGAAVRAAIREFEPTLVAAFPKTFADLARMGLESNELGTVRRWYSMGDAMHGEHIRRVLVASPRAKFLDCFGSSELGMAVFAKESTLESIAPSRCVGRPVGISICKVIRPADGTECSDSELGLLSVRSPTITAGYWNQDERTAASWKNGYFLTGDVGFVKDGEYYLVDRSADVLRLRDATHYTLLIEERLQKLPDVLDATIVGLESDGQPLICIVLLVATTTRNTDGLLEKCIAETKSALGLP